MRSPTSKGTPAKLRRSKRTVKPTMKMAQLSTEEAARALRLGKYTTYATPTRTVDSPTHPESYSSLADLTPLQRTKFRRVAGSANKSLVSMSYKRGNLDKMAVKADLAKARKRLFKEVLPFPAGVKSRGNDVKPQETASKRKYPDGKNVACDFVIVHTADRKAAHFPYRFLARRNFSEALEKEFTTNGCRGKRQPQFIKEFDREVDVLLFAVVEKGKRHHFSYEPFHCKERKLELILKVTCL